mmetsp:Transcript_150/g.317  ORF Transcript_150/g.317 Transcript_150/m.317 type:complete len:80 (-) Transcript_150:192-431(-)
MVAQEAASAQRCSWIPEAASARRCSWTPEAAMVAPASSNCSGKMLVQSLAEHAGQGSEEAGLDDSVFQTGDSQTSHAAG